MKNKDEPSNLVAAVNALELELLNLERLTEAALRHPLNSEKHIQQTASSLQGIGAMEERLKSAMGQLMTALNELGQKQQQHVVSASARADELKARHDVFVSLMLRFTALGQSAAEIQAALENAGDDSASVLVDVMGKLGALANDAVDLEKAAEDADFIDVTRNARSLRQQLQSAVASMGKRVGSA